MNIFQFMKLARVARNHIIHFMPNYWPDDLAGACGTASYHLMKLANAQGARPTFVAGYFNKDGIQPKGGHCWTKYHGYIVDITATQFSEMFGPLYVVPDPNIQYVSDFETEDAVKAYGSIESWTEYPDELKYLINTK